MRLPPESRSRSPIGHVVSHSVQWGCIDLARHPLSLEAPFNPSGPLRTPPRNDIDQGSHQQGGMSRPTTSTESPFDVFCLDTPFYTMAGPPLGSPRCQFAVSVPMSWRLSRKGNWGSMSIFHDDSTTADYRCRVSAATMALASLPDVVSLALLFLHLAPVSAPLILRIRRSRASKSPSITNRNLCHASLCRQSRCTGQAEGTADWQFARDWQGQLKRNLFWR